MWKVHRQCKQTENNGTQKVIRIICCLPLSRKHNYNNKQSSLSVDNIIDGYKIVASKKIVDRYILPFTASTALHIKNMQR